MRPKKWAEAVERIRKGNEPEVELKMNTTKTLKELITSISGITKKSKFHSDIIDQEIIKAAPRKDMSSKEVSKEIEKDLNKILK